MTVKRFRVARRIRQYLAPHGHVDALTGTRVTGWAVGRSPLAVEAWLGDRCIACASPDIARPDVAHVHPDREGAATSGFTMNLPVATLAAVSLAELRIIARPIRRWLPSARIASLHIAGDGPEHKLAHAPDSGLWRRVRASVPTTRIR